MAGLSYHFALTLQDISINSVCFFLEIFVDLL